MTVIHTKTPLESLFNSACGSGDLELLKTLTTSSSKHVLDVNNGFNYGLRRASSNGHIEVLDYLINYPDIQRRKEILNDISSAIDSAAKEGQLKSLLYFKKHFPKEYNDILNTKSMNYTLDSLTMSGKIEALKYMLEEFASVEGIEWYLLIKKSIQYDKRDCFDFFLKRTPPQYLENLNNAQKEEILHTCLYHKRFDLLPFLIQYIDVSQDLSVNHFNILIGAKIESLYHIITEYNYQPHEKLQLKINDYLENNNDNFAKDLNKLMKAIENKQLSQKMSSELKKKKNVKNPKL